MLILTLVDKRELPLVRRHVIMAEGKSFGSEDQIMLRQIRYFQSVVRNNSFTEAAEECHISQSAISQQIRSLENELGFQLLKRHNRKFALTPAGEYFYRKSLILTADYDAICREAHQIAHGDTAGLRIGFLRGYQGRQIRKAIEQFTGKYPEMSLHIEDGTHEELFQCLQTGELDLVLNDQRRAFSDEYVNLLLANSASCIEVSEKSPLSSLGRVSPEELKNIPCILITSKDQQETERKYYHDIMGFKGDYIYAENLEEARLLVIGNQGFMPTEDNGDEELPASVVRIPLMRGNDQMTRNYGAFWKKRNSGYYIEEFAEMLKAQFSDKKNL